MGLCAAAEALCAQVVFAPVAVPEGRPQHDPVALAKALREVFKA
jgi:hypothetical protein